MNLRDTTTWHRTGVCHGHRWKGNNHKVHLYIQHVCPGVAQPGPAQAHWNCRGLGEATCTTEMSLLMACWKQNEFNDAACAKEIQTFYDCVAKADVERKERLKQESLGQMGTLSPKTVNKLLRRFPNITDNF
nr:coiled-coil-helix-coiled-coil-helix domain-containing protein 1 [Chelonoidis abingdonii]